MASDDALHHFGDWKGNWRHSALRPVLPFTIIIAIFLLLGVIALLAPLPDVKAAGEDESDTTTASNSYADGKTSILQFPHLLLGCLALFLYVGVETISLATATGYAQSLGLEGDNYGFIPSVGMIVGYVCGVIFIPRYLSQAAAMRICAIIALVGSIAVAVVPNPVFSVCCIFLMALRMFVDVASTMAFGNGRPW